MNAWMCIWMAPNCYASGLINFSNHRWIIFNVDCGNVQAYNWPTSTLLLWSLSASVWRSRLLFRPNALSRPYLYYKLHLFPKFEWRDCGPCSGIIYVWTLFVFILQVRNFWFTVKLFWSAEQFYYHIMQELVKIGKFS